MALFYEKSEDGGRLPASAPVHIDAANSRELEYALRVLTLRAVGMTHCKHELLTLDVTLQMEVGMKTQSTLATLKTVFKLLRSPLSCWTSSGVRSA
jgi:hypothetical protein